MGSSSNIFDPYYKWLGISPSEQPASYYRLLAIAEFEADRDVISYAADRAIAHVRSLRNGPRAEHAERLLNELTAARLCLLDPKRKAAYDAGLSDAEPDEPEPPPPPPAPPPAAKAAMPIASPAELPAGPEVKTAGPRSSAARVRRRVKRDVPVGPLVLVGGICLVLAGGLIYVLQREPAPGEPSVRVVPHSADRKTPNRTSTERNAGRNAAPRFRPSESSAPRDRLAQEILPSYEVGPVLPRRGRERLFTPHERTPGEGYYPSDLLVQEFSQVPSPANATRAKPADGVEDIRIALRQLKPDVARRLIKAAAAKGPSTEEKARLAALETLAAHMEVFHASLLQGASRLPAGETFVMPNDPRTRPYTFDRFASETRTLHFQAEDQRYRWELEKLPVQWALRIARPELPDDEKSRNLSIATFQALYIGGDRNSARQLWAEAIREDPALESAMAELDLPSSAEAPQAFP